MGKEPFDRQVRRVMESPDYIRSITELAEYLGYRDTEYGEDFIKDLTGKDVLDIGSGWGGLAKHAYLLGLNARITSVNPHFNDPNFMKYEAQVTQAYFLKHGYKPDKIEEAQAYHDQRKVCAFAHDLRDVSDDSQDFIIDNNGFSFYYFEKDPTLYKMSILEMMRVLRKGGKIRIGDASILIPNGPDTEKIRALKELGIEFTPLMNTLFPNDPSGIEIVKK